jgi:spore coat protein CotH
VTGTVLVNTRIRPFVTGTAMAAGAAATFDIDGTRDIFDSQVGHEVYTTFAEDGYQRMLQAFTDGRHQVRSSRRNLVVDGVRIPASGCASRATPR